MDRITDLLGWIEREWWTWPLWLHDRWHALTAWMLAHELAVELGTVWVLVATFAILAVVKVLTWDVVRRQRDRTAVGRALKRQKLAEAVLYLALGLAYGASLTLYYDVIPIDVWWRYGLRIVAALAMVTATVYGIRFALALRAQDWGEPEGGDER